MLTFEQIKELIELVAEHHLSGMEMERSGFRLRIDGYKPAKVSQVVSAPAPPAEAPVPQAPPPPAAPSAPPSVAAATSTTPPAEEKKSTVPDDAHILNSPIVGTFYRSPNPDSDPFVEVGDRVKKGQVLCIVEAMKLMNEIESEVDGVVLEIYRQNGQPVEFGEPLFAIKT